MGENMKIINLSEFRKLPPGTIFSKYQPCIFDGPMCKQETAEIDFFFETILNDVENDSTGEFIEKCAEMEKGKSHKLEVDALERDGMFDKCQLFAVYEKEDIEQLINKLKKCITEAY